MEFYDVARARAGTDRIEVEAATLAEALAESARRCPGLVPDIVKDGALCPHWRASLNGREFVVDPATPLEPGDCVLLLSALAGG